MCSTFAALESSAADTLDEAATLLATVSPHGGKKLHLRIGRLLNAVTRLSPKLGGLLAVELFIRPRRLKLSASAREALSRAQLLRLASKPQLVGYRWPGQARQPRVLLIHGWESHSARWLPLQQRLSHQGLEVVAFDGPAAGASGGRRTPFNRYVEAALHFEQAYGPFDAYVGHSLGGGVAIQLAARVSGQRQPRAVVVMASFDESEHVFDRYHDMLQLGPHVRQAFDRQIVRELGAGGKVSDYSNMAAVRQLADVQGLVVHSDDDTVSPIAEGLALHAAWPEATLMRLQDEGHRLTGAAILDDITAWIVQTASRG